MINVVKGKTMNQAVLKTTIRTKTAVAAARRKLVEDERGEISPNVVWVAFGVLAAIALAAILYAKLVAAGEAIDIDPGVG